MTKKSFNDETKFDVGMFFKEIRHTRGYTQKDAGGNYISKSQLSRFENGDTILTAEKLYYAITQISMTPNEFFNAFNDYKLDRMQKLYYTLDNIQLSLKEGIEKSEELITKYPDSKFEKLSNIMIKSVLQDITGKRYITKEECLLVGDYLSAIDYWSEFELKLLYYTCLILDEGDICCFWQLVTDRACHFNKGNNQKLFLATLLNIYELTVLDHQNMSNANIFRTSLQNFIVNKEPTILMVFTIVTYFHDYLLEKTSKNRKKIEDYLNATEIVGVKYMADYYRSRLVALDEK